MRLSMVDGPGRFRAEISVSADHALSPDRPQVIARLSVCKSDGMSYTLFDNKNQYQLEGASCVSATQVCSLSQL
jgi:hypothetical protein